MPQLLKTLPQLCTLPALILLTGCLHDDGSGSDNDHLTGQVTVSGIRGLSYRSASATGVTNDTGQFQYYPGERLQIGVGDLVLVTDVPADDIITPMDFQASARAALQSPGVNDEGLRDHRPTERQLLQDPTLLNMTRFLLALNWNETIAEGETLDIRDRVIEQLNAALAQQESPIDFSVDPAEFEAAGLTPSPANQLLAQICFYPEGDTRCDTPPTQAEIDAAPPRPIDVEERDPELLYQEDLIGLRERIASAVRNLEQFDSEKAENYLTQQLDLATRTYANQYYLDSETAAHPATDTAIHSVRLRKIGAEPELATLEAVSLREADVAIHAYDWQSATVEYFITGEAGGESDLLVNFRPEGDYRWLRKQLRVLIQ
ncbi:organic solvent ABC transporter permease [Marinobacter sp. SS21]|uniref:organic solvent ABC transporter permease n=1 Tax=Marinobacter sp. SS21 TaxID=2979460 RepID=UPI00232D0FDC|nr:organic solvent ABC transporter permease [Marinobacter sp. SS21]MDC0663271.1 organic solvent ABC transporter permease [Marinobacter sp. SS21]